MTRKLIALALLATLAAVPAGCASREPWLEMHQPLSVVDLPEPILTAIARAYPDASVQDAWRERPGTTPGAQTTYRILMRVYGKDAVAVYDASGRQMIFTRAPLARDQRRPGGFNL